MGRIEQSLAAEGYAVGSSLTLADLYLYSALQARLRPEEFLTPDFPPWRAEPFGDLAAVTKKLEQVTNE